MGEPRRCSGCGRQLFHGRADHVRRNGGYICVGCQDGTTARTVGTRVVPVTIIPVEPPRPPRPAPVVPVVPVQVQPVVAEKPKRRVKPARAVEFEELDLSSDNDWMLT